MKRRSSSASTQDERETQRQQYRKQLDTALDEEDDPLAIYHQFIQWTIKSYGETDPKSGLIGLLEEATRKFKDDPLYKADLRYLKLWTLHAKHSERHHALAIYKYLMTNEIGISYSLLYEEYANALELEGRKQDADTIYRRGIKRQVRPLQRLKSKHRDFQSRVGPISSATSSSKAPPKSSSSKKPTDDPQQKNPSITQTSKASPGTPESSPLSTADLRSTTSTAASRYALMMAPPAPGKRPEKLRFNLSLLFSDGQEYSIQEARARSMGLLGKKWSPPPASEMPRSGARLDFGDDGSKTMKPSGRKKSFMGGAEPTVTINTKEALADVFGMYNSPDKTKIFPGSKHAPVKKVDSNTVLPRFALPLENENAKTHSTLRPFVDENSQPNRITSGAKFAPFLDSTAHKTPVITPLSAPGTKGVAIPVAPNDDSSRLKTKTPVANDKPVFSKVFAPVAKFAPQRNTSGEARKKDGSGSDSLAFTSFVDERAKAPFKVFSRPGEDDEGTAAARVRNGLAPKTLNATFTPFVDKTPAFTPFRDIQEATAAPSTDRTPSGPISRSALSAISISQAKEEEKLSQELPVGQEEATEEYGDEYQEPEGQFEVPADDGEYEEDDDQYYRDAPLGGRFGQFNVMTPITERTCEFTMGTTPKDPQYESPEEGSTGSLRGSNVFIPSQVGEHEALKNAERLAAELREEPDIEGEEEENEVIDEPEEEYVQVQMQQLESDHLMDGLEERAASLSLAEKQSPSQQFHFSNPCNPFEFTVLSLLLSQVPSDEHFYDLHDQTSKRVEALKKSTRKSAPLSPYTLALDGHRFMVSEKLGEGGFGSVFKARDMGKRTMAEEEDDFDDLDIDLDIDLEDDESSSSFVAIKVVKPRNIWEYHVLRRLHASLPSSLCRSLVLPHALYAYSDESFLVLSLCSQGMLLNIINNAVSAGVSQQGACLDELLVMFFSIELIRLVEGIHNAGFIHGDLKIDNCLLRLEDIPGGSSAWDAQYQPSGEDGWSYKGLKLIDFGRTIDTTMFPSGQEYLTDWATDERDCFELRQGRPWTFQTDYFGLAGIIYCMLFGKYLQESSIALISEPELELESKSESETKRYKIGTPLKRYWQGDIWNRLFDVLLNPCLVQPDGTLPICEELASIRKDMEVWLQVNCNRSSNTLKGLLKKVEKSCYTT